MRSYRKLPSDKVLEDVLARNSRPDNLCSVRRFNVAAGIYIVRFFWGVTYRRDSQCERVLACAPKKGR